MTDTNTLAPTDAELMQVIKDVTKNSAINRDGSTSLRIARAVLARWGGSEAQAAAPAQAVRAPPRCGASNKWQHCLNALEEL